MKQMVYKGSIVAWMSSYAALGGVDESQKCISTGPYERF